MKLDSNQQPQTKVGRIGSVPYLNAKPLIFGIEQNIKLEVPTLLARDLRENRLDAALMPVAEYLEYPHYQIVPGIAIGSHGPVQSVYLAHRVPISELKVVALDPASKTSNMLVQVVLASFYGCFPQCQFTIPGESQEGELLIGDAALLERNAYAKRGYNLLDLGEAWRKNTGLPFVYAIWGIRGDLQGSPYIELFSRAKQNGLQNLNSIATAQKALPSEIAHEYLTRSIRYDFAQEEIRGLLEFQRLCLEHSLIDSSSDIRLAT